MDVSAENYRHWPYKNSALLLLSLVCVLYLSRTDMFGTFATSLATLRYGGAFIAGIFFTSIFTVAPALILLQAIAHSSNPWLVALAGGAGAVLGDYLIFRYIRTSLQGELIQLAKKFGIFRLRYLWRTPYFAWIVPLMGALIIASPLPDELGVGLLGISKVKSWQFLFLSFCLNTGGISVFLAASHQL